MTLKLQGTNFASGDNVIILGLIHIKVLEFIKKFAKDKTKDI